MNATVRQANNFNFGAILEVAALFFGIFICMQPPLQILEISGPRLGTDRTLAFLLGHRQPVVVPGQRPDLRGVLRDGQVGHRQRQLVAHGGRHGRLLAVPDRRQPGRGVHGRQHLHRQRAELHGQDDRGESGVKMPSFFGYMVYSICILIPLFVLTGIVFT